MGIKDKAVLVIGLVAIFVIASLIIYGSSEVLNDEAKAAEATNGMLLQQKDVLIAKLVSQLRAEQAQLKSLKGDLSKVTTKLDDSKAEVEGAKKKLDNIREELNTPIEIPASKK